jgi:hypothetical protein
MYLIFSDIFALLIIALLPFSAKSIVVIVLPLCPRPCEVKLFSLALLVLDLVDEFAAIV